MINRYVEGSQVRTSVTFRVGTTPVDPGDVFVDVRPPSGMVASYKHGIDLELVKDGVGNYHLDIDADAPGDWHYWWHSGAPNKAAAKGRFTATRKFAP